VPESGAVWGLSAGLSLMVKVPFCGPDVVGVEGKGDLAFSTWEQTFAAVVGLAKLSAGLDGSDVDRVAGADLYSLRRAGGAKHLRDEGQARRRKCHARRRTDAGKRSRLRASGRIVGNADDRTSISRG
jgi:hypothetical protein